MRVSKDCRVFFALWPDDDTRLRLQSVIERLSLQTPARSVPTGNLHLTLHFIGNILFNQLDCLRQQAQTVVAKGFDLSINRSGSFSKPRVGWLGCDEIPDALTRLHTELSLALDRCNYQPETRPYHPHITVARKIQAMPCVQPFAPIDWMVREFVLVESRPTATGVEYVVIDRFPLT